MRQRQGFINRNREEATAQPHANYALLKPVKSRYLMKLFMAKKQREILIDLRFW